MLIKAIASVDTNYLMGINGELAYRNSEDLRFFREKTMGGIILAAKNTYEEVKNLSGRAAVLLTRANGHKLFDTFALCEYNVHDIWLVGGATAYREYLQWCDVVYLSRLQQDLKENPEGELTYFPHEVLHEHFELLGLSTKKYDGIVIERWEKRNRE